MASLHVSFDKGEKGSNEAADDPITFCNCLRKKHHLKRGGEGSYNWRPKGQEEHCPRSQDDHSAGGLARASQIVVVPAPAAQVSTGSQRDSMGGKK